MQGAHQDAKRIYTDDEIACHLNAYGRVRHYHQTRTENTAAILDSGLLRRFGASDTGATNTLGHRKSYNTKNMIHLATEVSRALIYKVRLNKEGRESDTIRAFISEEDRLEFERDPDEAAAIRTKNIDIPKKQLMTGKFSNLSQAQKEDIFNIVLEFYPQCGLDGNYTVQDAINMHEQAIRQGKVQTFNNFGLDYTSD